MPYATLHLVGPNKAPETKRRLQTETTDILVGILNAVRPLLAIRIVEEAAENWSVGGKPLDPAEGVSGVLAVVTIAEGAASTDQIANAVSALASMLKEVLGANSLPPYVVFELVGENAWGYKGRTIAAIKQGTPSKAA